MNLGNTKGELVPSVWAGYAMAWFSYWFSKDRGSHVRPPLYQPYTESFVIKDADLARPNDELMTRFLEPMCEAIMSRIQDRAVDTARNDKWRTDGNTSAFCRAGNLFVDCEMSYDRFSAGTRVTLTYQRLV